MVFGPFIEIILSMIRKMMVFMSLLVLVMAIYVFVGSIFFVTTDEFDSYEHGFLFLFQSMLGSFNFDFYDDADSQLVPGYISKVYMMSYLIVTMIVLLNMLIAILSDVYVELQGRSKQLYLTNVIKTSHILGYDKYYSSLVAMPAPFNVLLLPLYPWIIRKKRSLNRFLVYCCYVPALCIVIIIFSITSLIYTIPAYLILLWCQFTKSLRSCLNGVKSVIIEWLTLLAFIPFGYLYMLIIAFLDAFYFIIDLYRVRPTLKNQIEQNDYNGYADMTNHTFNMV